MIPEPIREQLTLLMTDGWEERAIIRSRTSDRYEIWLAKSESEDSPSVDVWRVFVEREPLLDRIASPYVIAERLQQDVDDIRNAVFYAARAKEKRP